MSFDLCDAPFFFYIFIFGRVGRNDDFLVLFLKNKIKIVMIFSGHYVKLIILKGLMSLLVHYIP